MLKIKPTDHLTGVTIQGDFDDLYELVESIYRITGPDDDPNGIFYGVKNRLLGLCYDIRHAYQSDRNIFLVDNGMYEEAMKWHGLITPKQNVYYSVEALFPEALFVATSAPQMCLFSMKYYGEKHRQYEDEPLRTIPMSQYYRDKANLDVLSSAIWQALGQAIEDDEVEKLLWMKERTYESFMHYATHYIDKCNLELLKTPVDKRKDKLRNIAKRIIKRPAAYWNLERDLKYWAKEYKTNIYAVHDPKLVYPEHIEW